MLNLDYRDARPIYEQVRDGLRRLMVSGVIQEGEQLPSVRAMATSLAINPNTIQRAYRELELQGWIVSVPGKGSFVGTIPTTGEMRDLYDRFDRTALELLAAGATTRALRERIPEKGAENNA